MRVVKQLKRIQQKIDNLEKNGWEVNLYYTVTPEKCNPYRGHTVFIAEKGDMTFEGSAQCSKHDIFSRRVGTEVAFNRLLRDMSAHFGRKKMQKIFNC